MKFPFKSTEQVAPGSADISQKPEVQDKNADVRTQDASDFPSPEVPEKDASKVDTTEEIKDDNGEVIGKDGTLASNKAFILNRVEYKTDDQGKIYSIDGELKPNTEYTVNGITYKTDSQGRILSWEGEPGYNPEAERDENAQTEAGGEDRQEGDDGGHLVARVLGGSSGNENIVPMRYTVNRGDYNKAENEIAKAKQEGKNVQDSGKIEYDGDSSRPSKIERTYTIDGETRVLKVDNVEGSQDLLKDGKDDISEDDYKNLEERIEDMEADGSEVSITSAYKKYDSDGNLVSVTVGLRDETNGTKTYIKYGAK